MNALASKLHTLWRGLTTGKPVNHDARPMTGFFAHLTPEQKQRALNYEGPENHGDAEFLVRK